MPHISFSELRNWKQCPFYHKLTYIDKIAGFVGNEFTAFGRAIHDSCEKLVLEGDDGKMYGFFMNKFEKEIQDLLLKEVDLRQVEHQEKPGNYIEQVQQGIHQVYQEAVPYMTSE